MLRTPTPRTIPEQIAAWLIAYSWNYLQIGITKIMTNLQDGMDMTAVCLMRCSFGT